MIALIFVVVVVASIVAWGLSQRWERAPAGSAPSPKGAATIYVILGAIEFCCGAGAFLVLAAAIFARTAFRGLGPPALLALLFTAWGMFLGICLMISRTATACRSAAFWYLPVALIFAWGCAFGYQHENVQTVRLLLACIAFLGIFTIMIVPLVPGVFAKDRRLGGRST